MILNALVEGLLDEVVAQRIVQETGHTFGRCYGKHGVGYIQNKIVGFNRAARGQGILCLVDLMDTKLPCAPEVVETWLPHREPDMFFRVVVREIESWLIADRENLANFLSVNIKWVPTDPEKLPDPKLALINIARKSLKRSIQDSLVSRVGASEGPLYATEMSRFVREQWDLRVARKVSTSLDKCLTRLACL